MSKIKYAGQRSKQQVEILDTTLRDGEQTRDVSFSPDEKLSIAKMLLERVGVDRVEVASARVSRGERLGLEEICSWAKKNGLLDKIEALGFCDIDKSAEWIGGCGCKVMNILAKGSLKHLEGQLRKTPEQHLKDVTDTVEYCARNGIACNCYPEDWSNGVQEKAGYAKWFVKELSRLPIKRIMLADTLGILGPEQVRRFVGETVQEHPRTHFDFHGHNDYGLATANTLAAILAGAKGIHATVNGLGERAGNTPLDEVSVAIKDMLLSFSVSVDEAELIKCSRLVELFSGRELAANKPISGAAVFTQTCGVHADGDKKGDLYVTRLSAERFGMARSYALGKLAGKASLEMNLRRLNLQLSEDQKKLVLERVVELGDKKQIITSDDLPFVIADVLKSPKHRAIEIKECTITTTKSRRAVAEIDVLFRGKEYKAKADGDGGYDAFMKALGVALREIGIKPPRLVDYNVRIPPGGSTDALVETTITWEGDLRTRGVDSDQVLAAIEATENMLNMVLSMPK